MKAIQIRNAGGPEVLELVDIAQPQPAPGEVLVRAVAIGVGKPDVLMRTGVYRWMPALPATPGTEMTGTIAALGDGVAARFPELRVGDQAGVLILLRGAAGAGEALAVPLAPGAGRQELEADGAQT